MNEERIIIDFLPDGTVEVRTKGYAGSSCMEASKWIEEALGAVTDVKKTSEYYQEKQRLVQQNKYGG
jgi:hypothetical protein